jgi:hypothetical protein
VVFPELYGAAGKFGIAEMGDPIAGVDVMTIFPEGEIKGKMPVAENKVVDWFLLQDFFTIEDNPFPFIAPVGIGLYFSVFFQPGVGRPGVRQPDSQIRMNPPEATL